MSNIYKCISNVKYKKSIFNVGELVSINSKNGNYYLIVDLNYTKGLSIPVIEFEKKFKLYE